MALAIRLNMWPRTRYTGTTESVPEQLIRDKGSDAIVSSARERTARPAGRRKRVGSDADDAILTGAALAGQVWAEREIWFRFAPMVYGLFRRALGPGHDDDDLTQEVFLRVFRRLQTLERASAIRSFVYSVAVRVLSEEVRRFTWRRRIVEQRPEIWTPSTSGPADFEARETMERVQRSLDGMCDRYRAVFVLRYVNGMEARQIGTGLGVSEATVKRYLAKALAFIQKSLPKEEGRERPGSGVATAARLFGGGR